MPKFSGSLLQYPARALFTWYIGLILSGAALLRLPWASARPDQPISALDALFTSTSACCVTGLTVRSTAHDFSTFGQVIIVLLIQLGGVGILTLTNFFALGLGGRAHLRQKALLQDTLGTTDTNLRRMIARILLMVFSIELIGFAVMAGWMLRQDPSWFKVWQALFNSISAFCNAGFALDDQNIVPYQGDWVICSTIMALIVTGGLGFPVVGELLSRATPRRDKTRPQFSLHAKIMLVGTAALVLGGAGSILALEWNGALRGMPLDRRILVSFFQSVVPRTAGFNSIDLGLFSDATLLVIIVLMLIGAGPCSTAGGFKVSTLMVLACHSWSKFYGRMGVSIFRRTIPREVVDRSMATALLFIVVAVVAVGWLLVAEQHHLPAGSFLRAAFEVASALGTVGLSVNFTTLLDAPGRLILITLMFLGRVGPLTAVVALSLAQRKGTFEYAKEEILIG